MWEFVSVQVRMDVWTDKRYMCTQHTTMSILSLYGGRVYLSRVARKRNAMRFNWSLCIINGHWFRATHSHCAHSFANIRTTDPFFCRSLALSIQFERYWPAFVFFLRIGATNPWIATINSINFWHELNKQQTEFRCQWKIWIACMYRRHYCFTDFLLKDEENCHCVVSLLYISICAHSFASFTCIHLFLPPISIWSIN